MQFVNHSYNTDSVRTLVLQMDAYQRSNRFLTRLIGTRYCLTQLFIKLAFKGLKEALLAVAQIPFAAVNLTLHHLGLGTVTTITFDDVARHFESSRQHFKAVVLDSLALFIDPSHIQTMIIPPSRVSISLLYRLLPILLGSVAVIMVARKGQNEGIRFLSGLGRSLATYAVILLVAHCIAKMLLAIELRSPIERANDLILLLKARRLARNMPAGLQSTYGRELIQVCRELSKSIKTDTFRDFVEKFGAFTQLHVEAMLHLQSIQDERPAVLNECYKIFYEEYKRRVAHCYAEWTLLSTQGKPPASDRDRLALLASINTVIQNFQFIEKCGAFLRETTDAECNISQILARLNVMKRAVENQQSGTLYPVL